MILEANHLQENLAGEKIVVSIIIPIYNAQNTIVQCLDAIFRNIVSGYEVIIAVDGSTDQSLSILETYSLRKPIRWTIIAEGPLGPANARNVASEMARGSLLFFVDADVLVYPDTIKKVIEFYESHPQYTAMFGSYDQSPSDSSFFSQYKNLSHAYVHQHARVEASTFWTGCGVVRRSAFFELGGFDAKKYPRPSIEDIELGGRLILSGYRIYLNKDIVVKHLKKWTLWGLVKSDIYDRGIPWMLLILENRNLPNDLNLNQGQRVSAGLAMIVLILLGIGAINLFIPIVAPSYFIILLVLVSILIIILNFGYYKYFFHERGLLFTMGVFPMQLLYYWYSIFALLVGVSIKFMNSFKKTRNKPVS